jgi:hypothetical protein
MTDSGLSTLSNSLNILLRSFCTLEAGGSPGSFAAEAGADTGRQTEEE